MLSVLSTWEVYLGALPVYDACSFYLGSLPGRDICTQVKWGGTHRFNDAAAVEAKHRVSLKAHGEKIRVRSETQTEKDLLRVTQEELIFEYVQELLDDIDEDPGITVEEEMAAYIADQTQRKTVSLTVNLHFDKYVCGNKRGNLVHREVLLSWGELFDKFGHCFPSVACPRVQEDTKWGVYQHCLHAINEARYHYWGTDSAYPAISRAGGAGCA